MAAIPFFLWLGNEEALGSYPLVPQTFLGGTEWTLYLNKRRLKYTVPYDPATGYLPGTINFTPWFDHSLNATLGNFTVYHHIKGALITSPPYDVNHGDNTQNGGLGCGATAWLMQLLADRYTASPYFKAMKYVAPGGIPQWKVGGTAYTPLATKLTRALTLVSPDTLDCKFIVIDINGGATASPYGDIKQWATSVLTYITDMTALIAQLRTTLSSPNAKVFLICHAPSYLLTSGTIAGATGAATALFNSLNQELSYSLSNVHVVPMADKDLSVGGPTSYTIVSNDMAHYQETAYFDQAQTIFDTFVRATDNPSTPTVGNIIPSFMMVGDSKISGEIIAAVQANLVSSTLGGPRVNQYIYNATVASLQLINPGANSNFNTCGAVTTNVGYALTLTEKLGQKYPDGMLFFNMAMPGGGLSAPIAYTPTGGGRFKKGVSESYEQMMTHMNQTRYLATHQTSSPVVAKSPIFMAAFISLGHNDAGDLTASQNFKAELKNFIRNIRADILTKIYGIEAPVIMILQRLDMAVGLATGKALVRQAQIEVCDEMDNVGYVNVDDLDFAPDGTHDSVESAMLIGYRLYDKWEEMVQASIPIL